MLIASVGPALAAELGFADAAAAEKEKANTISFGPLEPLVGLMQETPVDKLLPALVGKLQSGTDLKTLISAAALANARTFGGQDYIGFHTLMALAPAYEMSRELPETLRPLPVLKVLYRNTNRIQAHGGCKSEVLHPVEPAELPKDRVGGEVLQAATRQADFRAAEAVFAALAQGPVGEAYNHLQYAVQDEVDVHRVVLAWRAWVLLDFTGQGHAHTLLRQSVRYCVNSEKGRRTHKYAEPGIRKVLPKLLDQYHLLAKSPGDRRLDDAGVEQLSLTIYGAGRDRAAEAVAGALADGIAPEVVGEAIALAANRLVLCDRGRQRGDGAKPIGSVHGDSVGVHASDAANAWKNIARVSNQRNAAASLITAAYHTAGQDGNQHKQPYPFADQLEKIQAKAPEGLLRQAEAAIKEKDQAGACALVHRYGELGYPARPVFDLLLRYATSEDGALHAEKYYRTVSEEFASARPAFRWRQLAALARVTASECGLQAPGYAEARRLLKV
jgi:hypothetical protein